MKKSYANIIPPAKYVEKDIRAAFEMINDSKPDTLLIYSEETFNVLVNHPKLKELCQTK